MLWIALHFPALALDVFARGIQKNRPLATASSPASNASIIACNRAARDLGVRNGMPVTSACALGAGLAILARDADAEQAALSRVATWALQFTPVVSIASPTEVLLEVSGSLKLFAGLQPLHALLECGVAGLGYQAIIACAPTPLAAQLCARSAPPIRIRHRDTLRASLERLSISALDLPQTALVLLRNIGVHTLGECLRLPRDGLARRLGPELSNTLDRALGNIPDPRPGFVPPAHFTTALTLPAPVENAAALLFAARRLLAELCGFLAATGNGVQRLVVSLAHDDHPDTHCTLDLVAASRDLDHLVSVLRNRLEHLALPSAATALLLESALLLPVPSRSLSFLPGAREHRDEAAALIERLRARLGNAAVSGLDTVADHRPECAWQTCEPTAKRAPQMARSARPLWLLSSPRPLREISATPCYEGPLTLLEGPERIESGWWDGNDVARDYFVASNPADSLLWIYRERCAGGGWHLHGFFS
jgi:protein ImuB